MNAKEQVISTITEWADTHIDTIVEANPRMAILAPRLKQGLFNYLHQKENILDKGLLFITDKDGKLDVGDFFEEAVKMFDEMPIQSKKFFGLDVNIGRGAIEAKMPDNFFVNMLMGSTGSIKFTSADFMELKSLLAAKSV